MDVPQSFPHRPGVRHACRPNFHGTDKRDLVLRFPQSVVIILLGRITQNVPQQLPTMDLSFSNFARVEASQNIGQIHDPRFTDTDHARRPVDFG